MKATFLLLTTFTAISGSAVLSLPAAAECWMTCPPGTTTTPSAAVQEAPTAEAEPVISPEASKPAMKAEAKEQGSPSSAPAKKKAAPAQATATATPSLKPEAIPTPRAFAG